jgi:iron(III) transport system substrate-binding protein
MADGNEYNLIQLKEQGQPVEIIYPTEGTPDHGTERAVQGGAESNAARLFQNWLNSRESQQLLVDFAHPFRARAGPAKARQQSAQGNQNT